MTTYDPKTCLTNQQPALLIRLDIKSSPADVKYYNSSPLRSPTTSLAKPDSQWSRLWYQISQSGPTCKILSALGLVALTNLFLVTTHGPKIFLISQQPALLIMIVTKFSAINVEYYRITFYLSNMQQLYQFEIPIQHLEDAIYTREVIMNNHRLQLRCVLLCDCSRTFSYQLSLSFLLA